LDSGLQSFEDMLTRVDGVLENPHTSSVLLEKLRKRYRYAVVDEFQDTDQVQWRIFRRIS
jgi:exodeoxyribonuclease V beta subunit